jgi:glycosyltransferase involved in cell wall biosynthesis
MRSPGVVLVHNRYQQAGGEDAVFAAETALLRRRQHAVATHTADNRTAETMGRVALAGAALWNRASYRDIRRVCRDSGASIAHFHNTFPLVSPSGYYAARAEGVAVVQTLHNYRLICPGGNLFRDGRTCTACVGAAVPLAAVRHACYRGDRQATAVTLSLLTGHRLIGTWRHAVDVYVALTEFARRRFIEGGLPADRVVVKPNFLAEDPGVGSHDGGFALFVGRLTEDKGVATLVRAWDAAGGGRRLKIAGTGPLERMASTKTIEWLGWQSGDRVLELMRAASFLVMPSTWFEGFPVTLLQAFATALPVIVSGHGSLAEIVADGVTGRHVPPGDSEALAQAIDWAWTHPAEIREMGRRGRDEFESRYTAQQHYDRIVEIYRRALAAPSSALS